MSDDARPLIDNPYRASHTPIIAGDVNVTDLMARAWDRGFAAGDERLRSDFAAASPDERLREAGERLAQAVARVCGEGHPALGMWRVALAAADREAHLEPAPQNDATRAQIVAAKLIADREAPDEAGRICCRGMGADGGCNICAAEATR